jgi:hypothetical protein
MHQGPEKHGKRIDGYPRQDVPRQLTLEYSPEGDSGKGL